MLLFGCLFHDSVYFLERGKNLYRPRLQFGGIYVLTHIFALCVAQSSQLQGMLSLQNNQSLLVSGNLARGEYISKEKFLETVCPEIWGILKLYVLIYQKNIKLYIKFSLKLSIKFQNSIRHKSAFFEQCWKIHQLSLRFQYKRSLRCVCVS